MPARKGSNPEGALTYVALMRGLNVGGNNLLPMKDLAAMFTKAGCSDVGTYIQSGNVIFRADRELAKSIPAAIAKTIAGRTKMRIPILVRTGAELRRVVEENPFLRRGADTDKLHVVFLADPPAKAAVAALDPQRSPPDELAVRGAEIYLFCP